MSKIKVKNILISQPKPSDIEKSPFYEISKKYNLKIDYYKFFRIERLSSKEFREQKIYLNNYSAIIFTSRMAVDHYFSMAKDLRYIPPISIKYFCMSEAVAYYLQKYIQFRKRKIFFCNNNYDELVTIMKKHEKETFLLPCSGEHNDYISNLLVENGFKVDKGVFFRPVVENLSKLDIYSYDMIVFFSPFGVKSLKENFKDFKQNDIIIGGFGESTALAIKEMDLNQNIIAPQEKFPSMTMAIDDYLTKLAKSK
jgi:uroporphyrinogen-III synthase